MSAETTPPWRRTESFRAKRAELARRLRALPENRAKDRARSAVKNALRAGKLVPQPCETCGNDKSEAHHEDYSKPLSVTWLCRLHHAERHGHAIDPAKLATIQKMLTDRVKGKDIAASLGIDPNLVTAIKRGKYDRTARFRSE